MQKKAAVPSMVTICNIGCGFLAIYYASQGKLLPAAWLIVIAGFLDAFDGKLARMIDSPSPFGMQFDSLADICSFGVAPATLMLKYYEGIGASTWLPFAACFLFLLCGAVRLARFNLQAKGPEKDDFTGLPIPSAAAALAAYIVFTQRVWESNHEPQVAITLTALLSFLMVSHFEYPAFPKFTIGTYRDRARLGIALTALILVVLFTDEAFFPIALAFALSGVVRWLIHVVTDREVADIRN
ncbi:MAG: CDP-diacylglycerol--serine O-phosphatidyltransferase [bacterium]|nr:CDP-diacylglycerol--serine O-phosphatidyltransferase [bacterium]